MTHHKTWIITLSHSKKEINAYSQGSYVMYKDLYTCKIKEQSSVLPRFT